MRNRKNTYFFIFPVLQLNQYIIEIMICGLKKSSCERCSTVLAIARRKPIFIFSKLRKCVILDLFRLFITRIPVFFTFFFESESDYRTCTHYLRIRYFWASFICFSYVGDSRHPFRNFLLVNGLCSSVSLVSRPCVEWSCKLIFKNKTYYSFLPSFNIFIFK